jgi:hypothetical protein
MGERIERKKVLLPEQLTLLEIQMIHAFQAPCFKEFVLNEWLAMHSFMFLW